MMRRDLKTKRYCRSADVELLTRGSLFVWLDLLMDADIYLALTLLSLDRSRGLTEMSSGYLRPDVGQIRDVMETCYGLSCRLPQYPCQISRARNFKSKIRI